MPARRYLYSWEEIAFLDCDHIGRWGAFEPGLRETINFEGDEFPDLAFSMACDEHSFSAAYQWPASGHAGPGKFIQCSVTLARRPCPFGGERCYFLCPGCGNAKLRLAVLPEGLLCGSCGSVTWDSRRERPLQRLVRKADKVALRLGCDSWQDVPRKRPPHMRVTTYERLRAEHSALASEINREIARRSSRTRGGLVGQMAALVKLKL